MQVYINPLSFPVELRYDDVTLKRANEELALLFFFIIIDTSLLYSTNVYFTFKHILFNITIVRYSYTISVLFTSNFECSIISVLLLKSRRAVVVGVIVQLSSSIAPLGLATVVGP